MKAIASAVILAAATSASVRATVSINFGIGDMYASTNAITHFALGGRLNLLALTNGGSWGSNAAIAETLSNLTSSFVPEGAVLVGSFFADDSFGPGTGQTTINYSYGDGFAVGAPFLIVGYSSINNIATSPGIGTAGFFYRTDAVENFSDIAFVAPADGGTYALNALTLAQGGTLPDDALTSGSGAQGGYGFTTASPAPVITSETDASGTVGTDFTYQITASNSPTSFGATDLPEGLILNPKTGFISGTPTKAATSSVTISATNAGGTGSATFTLTISPAPVVAPVILDNTASGTVGTAFTYRISASNSPISFGATGLPAGLILDPATGFITGTPTTAATSSVTISATNAGGTGNATLTLTIGAAPPPPFLAPGTYNLPAGAKVKLGVTPPQGSAKYQWLKSGAPVKRATGPELDLTPGTTTFGPAQTGVYQLRQQQGTTVTTLGPWVLTHDDPTILVYNLTLNGTQSTSPDDSRTKGASESAVTMGGFLLVDRTPYDGDPPTADVKATLILTRIDRVGKKVVGSFYWVEPRPDASVHSNGPVPGTKSFPPSRTLVAGLLGTEQRENDPESPLWLAGDRDLLWLSGSDSLVALNKSRPPSLIVAPAVMNGVLGTVKATEGIEIGNLTVTARVNAADTLRARNEALNMEGVTRFIVDRLKTQKPPFTEIPPGQ